MLLQHDWPGNVRELQNVIEHAVVMGTSDVIVPEDLPDHFFERAREGAALPNYHEALNKTKRELLEKAFGRAPGLLKLLGRCAFEIAPPGFLEASHQASSSDYRLERSS